MSAPCCCCLADERDDGACLCTDWCEDRIGGAAPTIETCAERRERHRIHADRNEAAFLAREEAAADHHLETLGGRYSLRDVYRADHEYDQRKDAAE